MTPPSIQCCRTSRLARAGAVSFVALPARLAVGLKVLLGKIAALLPLKPLSARPSDGRGRLTLIIPAAEAGEVEIALPGGLKISPAVRGASA